MPSRVGAHCAFSEMQDRTGGRGPFGCTNGHRACDPLPALPAFETAVAQERVHYVLVGSAFASFGFGGAHFHLTPAAIHYFVELIQKNGGLKKFLGSGALGDNQSGPTAVDQWAQKHGTLVPSAAYGGTDSGTLYYVSPASAPSG
jgi:hypothetical protein